MARQPDDRENLLAEATALVERVEFLLHGYPAPAVAGFRRNGCVSLFFGTDPVLQFNTASQLRRAYVEGRLYKAESGRLILLDRQRRAGRLELVPQTLDAAAHAALVDQMTAHVEVLRGELEPGHSEIIGQVPPDADVLARLCRWLAALPAPLQIADRPHAR